MSATAADYLTRLTEFMVKFVLPAEPAYHGYQGGGPLGSHGAADRRETQGTGQGSRLWNLFLSSVSGLTNLEYAPLAEASGRCLTIAAEVLNCAVPDTGNMETLHLFAIA
jgi:acyl-CoA dehydrogenase